MSNDRQQVSYGHTHKGIGVHNYGLPRENYVPNKHNKPTPLRPGSQDAFSKPSLDINGEPIPYWGNK